MRYKVSPTDDVWIGRTPTEGWRIFQNVPQGSPPFVEPRQIDPDQFQHMDHLFKLLPSPSDVSEWEEIIADASILAKGPPAYMKTPGFHWLRHRQTVRSYYFFSFLLLIIIIFHCRAFDPSVLASKYPSRCRRLLS